MSTKQAFVFDTNFIIQHNNLAEVINKLKDKDFEVYVTQVSISERIAQECIVKKDKYKMLEALKKDVADIASIKVTKLYDEIEQYCRARIEKEYKQLFGSHIIPISFDEPMFQRVLERAYRKTPPFINEETDQGFKDTLIWLSILNYFKIKGEDEVVFVSDNKAFKLNEKTLWEEFMDKTNKTIDIQDNSYYETVTKVVEESRKGDTEKESVTLDIEVLRRQIKDIFEGLRTVETESFYSQYGQAFLGNTFTTTVAFDSEYIKKIFEKIGDVYKQHILEEKLPASLILDLDGRIKDGRSDIFISSIEQAIDLHMNIQKKYTSYLPQFYSAVAAILNKNFNECVYEENEDDVPF